MHKDTHSNNNNSTKHHKKMPSRPYSIKSNNAGIVIDIVLNKFSLTIKLICAVLPINESNVFSLTLKLISILCILAPYILLPIIFYIISFYIFDDVFFERCIDIRAECHDT